MSGSVLVVDDEATFRLLVDEALTADGFDVTLDGAQALRSSVHLRPAHSGALEVRARAIGLPAALQPYASLATTSSTTFIVVPAITGVCPSRRICS